MKNWNQLFIRHGWNVNQLNENEFSCHEETKENIKFLQESLCVAGLDFSFNSFVLTINSDLVSEEKWIEAVDFEYRGRGEGLWFRPGVDQPKVRELDTYISGIVRQLNRLGFNTTGSCDGHEKRSAYVLLKRETTNIEKLVSVLVALGQKRVSYRESRQHYHVNLPLSRNELLDLAENLSVIELEWGDKGIENIKNQLFNLSLEELLSIPGESGNEDKIRDYVKQRLTPLVDYITEDRHGNLIAERRYRTGNGPTILLNAHLDTVESIHLGRHIIKDGNIWTSSSGILGADDRAGVAVVLHMAEYLNHSTLYKLTSLNLPQHPSQFSTSINPRQPRCEYRCFRRLCISSCLVLQLRLLFRKMLRMLCYKMKCILR
ncbi:M28 family peptidase [Sutcliffiella sp. NC1]|uniref:M28 family peptidase n=1 Tax=Sutcliffiella sp. NC1 TaxID=3004096 RepID=UPI002FD6718E